MLISNKRVLKEDWWEGKFQNRINESTPQRDIWKAVNMNDISEVRRLLNEAPIDIFKNCVSDFKIKISEYLSFTYLNFFIFFYLKITRTDKNVLMKAVELGLCNIVDLITSRYPSLTNARTEVMICV
jgi:hypothetical protein